jgi:predicted RecA/RadA family phage recombinase
MIAVLAVGVSLFGVATPASASVAPRQATVEMGNLSQFDQTNAQVGTFAATTSTAYGGQYAAQAAYSGGGSNGFARGIFNVGWQEADDVRYGMAVFLPAGFKRAMQGEVDLMRWDNWDINPTHTDRCGVVIYSGDRKGHFVCWQLGVSGSATAQIGPFDIPEGRWVWLEVHQHLGSTSGEAMSQVWVDGQSAGTSTEANSFGRDVTRIRYGLVAIADGAQTNPLNLYLDRATVSTNYTGPLGSETPPVEIIRVP